MGPSRVISVEESWLDRGFVCYITHNEIFDTYNGYVEIPEDHHLHGYHYDEIEISVHGGLTYSDHNEITGEYTIGFDTNHFGDGFGENADTSLNKGLNQGPPRSVDYVRSEVNDMVDQLVENYDNTESLKTAYYRMAKFKLQEDQ